MSKTFSPGWYPGVPDEVYHSANGISSTALRKVLKSPAHYKASLETTVEPSDDMRLGTLTHLVVLQPDLLCERVSVLPNDAPKRPTAIQRAAKKPSQKALDAVAWWDDFTQKSEGKMVFGQGELDTANAMADSIRKHSIASMAFGSGQSEVSCWHEDEETGEMLKARFDYLRDGAKAIVDLKTCRDASEDGFSRHAYNMGYHIQAAYYLDLCQKYDVSRNSFVFVCVEKTPPYAVNVFTVSEASLALGRKKYRQALNTFALCKKTDSWPAYSEELKTLDLPKWAGKGEIEEF